MKRFSFLIIGLFFFFACQSPEGSMENSDMTEATNDTIDLKQAHSPKEKAVHHFPMSVAEFLSMDFQDELAEHQRLKRKDSIFESTYVPGDSVHWTYYRYKGSTILKLRDSTLLSISIKDQELLGDFALHIGMSLKEFKALFTDFDSLLNKPYEQNIPIVREDQGHYRIADDDMEYTGWLIGFLNDSLYTVNYNIYYEF